MWLELWEVIGNNCVILIVHLYYYWRAEVLDIDVIILKGAVQVLEPGREETEDYGPFCTDLGGTHVIRVDLVKALVSRMIK